MGEYSSEIKAVIAVLEQLPKVSLAMCALFGRFSQSRFSHHFIFFSISIGGRTCPYLKDRYGISCLMSFDIGTASADGSHQEYSNPKKTPFPQIRWIPHGHTRLLKGGNLHNDRSHPALANRCPRATLYAYIWRPKCHPRGNIPWRYAMDHTFLNGKPPQRFSLG